ncbi:MAG: extracellular solute-binding protein [Trueperaceae bacterium]|nr:extracellular solute-binding protein [Trueperaceae bacterium]
MHRLRNTILTLTALAVLSLAHAQTLEVWDWWTQGKKNEVAEQLNAEFEERNPGVTIERTSRPLDDLKVTVKLALGSGEGPDVPMVNQGAPDMGEMVQGGLIRPLDAYAEQYGWLDLHSERLFERKRWTEDGDFGRGDLYGVSPEIFVVGVYYNRAHFEEAGIDVPETFEEFQANLEALDEAGITPITFGNSDGWPAIHLYGAVQHLFVELDYLSDLIYGRGGSWVTDGNLRAAEIVRDWVESGYLSDGYAGLSYDDSWAAFARGEGAMMITGSEVADLFADNPDIGFFAMPPLEENTGTTPLHIVGTGIPFSISASTAHPDLAAAYIDWMMSERAAEAWMAADVVPALPIDEAMLEPGSLQADIHDVWTRIDEAGATGFYLDWATPSFYDTITAGLQRLLAGRIDAQQFVEDLDRDYQDYLASRD